VSNTHKELCWCLEGQDNDFEDTYLRDPRDGLISVSISSATPEALTLIEAAPQTLAMLKEAAKKLSDNLNAQLEREATVGDVIADSGGLVQRCYQHIREAEGTEVEA